MDKHIWLQIIISSAFAVILVLFCRLYSSLVATPRHLRRVLKQQGIGGPQPSFLLGNVSEIKQSRTPTAAAAAGPPASHNCAALVFSIFEKWRRQYGDMYTFSLGNRQILVVNDYEVVKEATTFTSFGLGKPSFLAKDMEALLGNGIVTSNGQFWAYQRKIIAPELFNHKVKGMTDLIIQSALLLIDSWKGVIDGEGGQKADIKIDKYVKEFSGDVISRACFGSNFAQGELLIRKLEALQQVTAKKSLVIGIPGMRYVPTKQNRRCWELQSDVRVLIKKLLLQEDESNSEKNMLRMILEAAESSNLSPDAIEKFIIDNCKNIYFAGIDTTSSAASWCLMLLASNQEWQHRVRQEVIDVCRGKLPDFESIKQMKQLTMVINESLRLYPPASMITKEALNELEFAGFRIPKGVILWILITNLNTDPDIWGSDSYQFKPERFANGVTGACKLPHLYMPFGAGPRMCLGLNLAMAELKILLTLILSNFSFSLSHKYVHAPVLKLSIEPGYGVDLVIEKLKLPVPLAS